jgi:hypothetical protein
MPLQTDRVPIQMGLKPFPEGEELDTGEIFSFETVTEDFLELHITDTTVDPPILDLSVRVSLLDQVPPGAVIPQSPAQQERNDNDSSTGKKYRQLLRSLQEENTNNSESEADDNITTPSDTLYVLFTATLRYRSESRDHDIAALVGSAWATEMEKQNYVRELQDASAAFDPVQDVDVRVQGYDPPAPTQAPTPDDGDKANIAVIVGASVGGAALLVLAGLLFFSRRRSKGSLKPLETEESKGSPTTAKQNVKLSTEILVEPQDDVSTLGDPMFGQGGMMMAAALDKDEVTAR